MKILLVGEYSRLHNSLKEGLLALGHEVTLIATGDYFKDYPADIKLTRKFDEGLGKKLKVGLHRLFNLDITSRSLTRQFFRHSERLKGYDVVQLINESALGATPNDEKKMLEFLRQHNKKLFLLSCGTDYLSVTYALDGPMAYSILNGYKDKTVPAEDYRFILKYTSSEYKDLHEAVFEAVDGVIASDMDYHLPLQKHPKYLGLLPNPVNTSLLEFVPLSLNGPIVIFMGINRQNYHTKGIWYFEEALDIIQQKFPNKVKVLLAENLPYTEYIEKYNTAHILLDQVLSYDQGYNALEAMAKGKVVFTGAGKDFREFYGLDEKVAINAVPDVAELANRLGHYIQNPHELKTIGENANRFVRREHDYIKIAQRYIDTWQKA